MTSNFKDAKACFTPELLHMFGREFCKHEVLWKPDSNWTEFQIQSARHDAYRMIAQALSMPMEDIIELSKSFPAACKNLMNRYEKCSQLYNRCLPNWLILLAEHLKLYNKTAAFSRHDLVRRLCNSAWAGLAPGGVESAGGGDDFSPLLGSQAVSDFASRHSLREEQILPVWHSVYKMCVVKLLAVLAAGDRTALVSKALRLDAHEREVTDLALLHDADVSQIKVLTPAKVRSLILLFQLVVAAKEVYDRERRRRYATQNTDTVDLNIQDGSNAIESTLISPNSAIHEDRCEAVADKNLYITPTHGVSIESVEGTNSDKIDDTIKNSNKLNSTVELSKQYKNTCNTQTLVQESVIRCKLRRGTNDTSDATEETDHELHTELDLEPDINIISSDASDNEMSYKYFEEYSRNMEVPILNEHREESGNNIIEDINVRNQREECDNASKSQDSDTRSQYPNKRWYEDSKSSLSEEQKIVWAMVYTDFIKRGRTASLISLQHRWVEILHRARAAILSAWRWDSRSPVHPLLLVVAHRFPEIVTESLSPWKKLVLERQIVLESDIKDIIHKYERNDNVLLNITENLASRDLIKEYIDNNDLNDLSNRNVTNKHFSDQINIDHPKVKENMNNTCIGPQDNVNSDLNVNNSISTILEQIDPSKAKVSIIFDEDSDEEDNNVSMNGTTPDITNLDLNSTPEATNLTQNDHSLHKCNKFIDIAIKNIEKELQDKLDYINNPSNSSDLLVKNKHTQSNEDINDNNGRITNRDISEYITSHDELNLLQPKETNYEEDCNAVIDEKLIKISRVVISPIEYLPEWKKHSRNGVIKCRSFSVRNFTKPVILNSAQLSKCRPYINRNKDTFDIKDNDIKSENDEYENENCMKNEVRIKFEDDHFDADFDFNDDVNNGITYQKYIELYSMSDNTRKNRITLSNKLKLSRTYFSSNFWSLDSNIEFMKLCKPMDIKLSRVLPRVAKRVELSDINEVRRINRSILTAQVVPLPLDTTPVDTQRSSSPKETINLTNNNISSNSGTTRQTNNSLSSALDSPELLKLLTNYAIAKRLPIKSGTESITRNNYSNNNLMDSIIEAMRLADKSNIQNSTSTSTLEEIPVPRSDPSELSMESRNTNISSASPHTQKSTEEVQNDELNAASTSVPNTASEINRDPNSTKEIYTKELQKILNNNPSNLDTTKTVDARDLKIMIQLLAKNWKSPLKHECSDDMKVNRNSLNVHLRNFEKEQRAFLKDISKLTKMLPMYVLNKPKRKITKPATTAKKQKKNNLINSEQAKERNILPNCHTDKSINETINKNSILDDDDEPNLVIDERIPELNDNIEINNSQCDKNKEISNKTRTNKKEKNKKKSKKKNKQSKITEEEAPMLNEYQEWQRQKTMALKYFTIPMSDTSKLTSNHKTTQSIPEHKSNGCQTSISIKRKSIQEVKTKPVSDTTKRPKLISNENDVVCISDTSDDDVQITEWNTSHTKKTKPVRNQNVCVIKTPVNTRPVYLLANNQMQISNPDTINKPQEKEPSNNPLYFQVLSSSTPFTAESQVLPQNQTEKTQSVLINDKNKRNIQKGNTFSGKESNEKRTCNKCQSPVPESCEEDLWSTLKVIQHVTCQDSRLNNPSTSQLNQKQHPVKEAITVEEYLSDNKKLTALIKIDETKKLLFFCNKYMILTDVNIPSDDVTYRTIFKTMKNKLLTKVLVPAERKGSVFLLYPKRESDFIYCECVKFKCNLCQHIEVLPKPANLLKIGNYYYKKMKENPIKYVRLTENEFKKNSRDVLEGNPDLILMNRMYFKMLTDTPPTYVRILSSVPDVNSLRHLVRNEVLLYAFDVTLNQHYDKPLVYTQTAGQITVEHNDHNLVKALQWFLNKP